MGICDAIVQDGARYHILEAVLVEALCVEFNVALSRHNDEDAADWMVKLSASIL